MSNIPAQYQDVWKPATEADKAHALASLSTLPSRAVGLADVDRGAYYLALEGVTRYGLTRAVKAILQNALGHAFFPSPPELRGQCDKAMEWHEAMAQRIRRRERENEEFNRQIGKPVERTEQGRARVSAAYQQFLDSYETGKADEEEAKRDELRRRYGMTPETLASIKDNPAAHERMGIRE